jgi:glycosyltransferase involved in cell wall biosynthesis
VRIGIDAHCLGQKKTGNETYTRELVDNLAHRPPNGHSFWIYLTEQKEAVERKDCGDSVRYHLIRPENAAFRLLLGFPIEARRRRLDVFHAQYFLPPGLGCKTVLTVHDISHERFPEFFTRKYNYLARTLIPDSCRRADWILTVSEHSKKDLVELYRLDPERITVTYNGYPEGFRPIPKSIAQETVDRLFGISSDYLLFVGALQPRKNLRRLLMAYQQLRLKKKIEHKLVIVGKKEWLFESIFAAVRDLQLDNDVIFTGYLPSEHLPSLFSAATVFIYPSIYEGFGMPVLESMACGTPVITSTGSSLEEIAHGAAVLVDPYDVAALSTAIEDVVTNPEKQRTLSEAGLNRIKEFSYRRMAEETLTIFERVASS